MKKLSVFCFAMAVLLSDVMCAVVAYHYRGMLCGIQHKGYSAPAGVACVLAVPFLLGIALCGFFAWLFRKKEEK